MYIRIYTCMYFISFVTVMTPSVITTHRYMNSPVARQPHGTWHLFPLERTCTSQRCHRTVIHEEYNNQNRWNNPNTWSTCIKIYTHACIYTINDFILTNISYYWRYKIYFSWVFNINMTCTCSYVFVKLILYYQYSCHENITTREFIF